MIVFVEKTLQDWERATDHAELVKQIIGEYMRSDDFNRALTALHYYGGDNTAVIGKTILKAEPFRHVVDDKGREAIGYEPKDVVGNRIAGGFFRRAVMQQSQYLLANGVYLEDDGQKDRLGAGFDRALEIIGRKALVQGVAWGFWNFDHIEIIDAARDALSGFVALLDELTGLPGVGIQFWQIDEKRARYVRVFERDGVTVYACEGNSIKELQPKRPYVQTVLHDATGETVIGGTNYTALPVIPFYANDEQHSELTMPIKSKIDAYDRIASDFADNLDRANDIYWVLNNFGGSKSDILTMLKQIEEIKAVVNTSDGTGSGSTAEPHTIEVPYAARQTALDLLRKALYSDYMALDMDTLRGGSLTNVAIKAAMADLDLKANAYEWQAFTFVQNVLRLLGVETEDISFKRQTLANASEVVQDIYMMRADLDRRTALEKNPYIDQDEIDMILSNLESEEVAGVGMEELEEQIEELRRQLQAQGRADEPTEPVDEPEE